MKNLLIIITTLLTFVCLKNFDLYSQTLTNPPKNIIIMIADGWGFNQIAAANYFLEGNSPAQKYEDFPIRIAMSHYPALAGDYNITKSSFVRGTGYNSDSAWSNFKYVKQKSTESAAAATALACGVKTYNGAIGFDTNYKEIKNLTEQAKEIKKSAGVITTVPWTHATPASFSTHTIFRKNYSEIALNMLIDTKLDVIMGAGHPYYNNNGQFTNIGNFQFVSDSVTWVNLKSGKIIYDSTTKSGRNTVQDCDFDGKPDSWKLIEYKADFIKLMNDKNPPKRVCGTFQANETAQQMRDYAFSSDFNKNIPTLVEMTKGAINILSRNINGFFLMIEGGAVDWANHDNQLGRMIEEMDGFNKSVDFVISWIEKNGGWDENLLIVLGDHECGYLTGPKQNDNSPITNPVINKGKGKMPFAKYNIDNHSNSLIPLFAKGNGCDLLAKYADEKDSIRGVYIQNNEVAQILFELMSTYIIHK